MRSGKQSFQSLDDFTFSPAMKFWLLNILTTTPGHRFLDFPHSNRCVKGLPGAPVCFALLTTGTESHGLICHPGVFLGGLHSQSFAYDKKSGSGSYRTGGVVCADSASKAFNRRVLHSLTPRLRCVFVCSHFLKSGFRQAEGFDFDQV